MSRESNDKLKVRATTDGLEIVASGGNIGNYHSQLQDLISPLAEGMGYIGDQIKLRRVQTAFKVLSRMHEIAAENGYILKPVKSKFLIELLEKSSVEDPNDKEMMEIWAKLLASASVNSNNAQVSYVDLLRVLRKEDAEILQHLALDTSPDASLDFYHLHTWTDFCEATSKRLNSILAENSGKSFGDILDLIEGLALQFNNKLLYIRTEGTRVLPTEYYKENKKSISILEREGAIKVEFGSIKLGNLVLEACWLRITKFGFDFVVACEGLASRKA